MRIANFLKDGFHGLCMACADSVPGVSGGTVAFLMGFYERFVGAINSLVFGARQEKRLRFCIFCGLVRAGRSALAFARF